MIAKVFRIYDMATSQNNTTEYPASPEAGDIIIAFNLRENPILDTSMLNILEKKLVKKKIIDIFNSVMKNLFQFMFYVYWVKNHDDKIKDWELKKCHDILKTRKKCKNEKWIIMKRYYIMIHKKIMKKLIQVEKVVKVMMKIKRFREWFRKNVVVKESNFDEKSNFDKRDECECS